MEKYIFFLKRVFIVSGVLSSILFFIDYFWNLRYHDKTGLIGLVIFLLFLIFIISVYGFFVFSDIQKNAFFYLSRLNYISLSLSLLFFIYCVLTRNPWGGEYIIFPLIFAFFNLIIMTIVFSFKKTGETYFYKDWLLFFACILFYFALAVLNRKMNS